MFRILLVEKCNNGTVDLVSIPYLFSSFHALYRISHMIHLYMLDTCNHVLDACWFFTFILLFIAYHLYLLTWISIDVLTFGILWLECKSSYPSFPELMLLWNWGCDRMVAHAGQPLICLSKTHILCCVSSFESYIYLDGALYNRA